MGRPHLGADHPVAQVRLLDHVGRIDRHREARPAAARVELLGGGEQRLSGDDVHVDAGLLLVPELVVERRLGGALLGHRILPRVQLSDGFWVLRYVSVTSTPSPPRWHFSPLVATLRGAFLISSARAPPAVRTPDSRPWLTGPVRPTDGRPVPPRRGRRYRKSPGSGARSRRRSVCRRPRSGRRRRRPPRSARRREPTSGPPASLLTSRFSVLRVGKAPPPVGLGRDLGLVEAVCDQRRPAHAGRRRPRPPHRHASCRRARPPCPAPRR